MNRGHDANDFDPLAALSQVAGNTRHQSCIVFAYVCLFIASVLYQCTLFVGFRDGPRCAPSGVGNGQAERSGKPLNGHAARVGESNGAVNGAEPIKHTLQSITAPVAEDMRQMQQNLKSVGDCC
jgi:hypothetical protein